MTYLVFAKISLLFVSRWIVEHHRRWIVGSHGHLDRGTLHACQMGREPMLDIQLPLVVGKRSLNPAIQPVTRCQCRDSENPQRIRKHARLDKHCGGQCAEYWPLTLALPEIGRPDLGSVGTVQICASFVRMQVWFAVLLLGGTSQCRGRPIRCV